MLEYKMSSPIDYKKFNLYPTPVYKSRIEVQKKWLDLCDNIDYERMKTGNGDISKNRNILNEMDLKNDIETHLNVYLRDWLKIHSNINFYLTSSWLVRHKKGDWSGMHHHTNSLVSGVYYLKTRKDSGDIKFHKHFNKNLFNESLKFEYTEDNLVNTEVVYFRVKPGDILIFPSHLNHSVTENLNNDYRYSLAFNTFCKGTLGKLEYSLTFN